MAPLHWPLQTLWSLMITSSGRRPLAFIQNEPRWRSFLGRRCCHPALKVTYYLHFQPLLSQKEKITSVLLDEGSGLLVARLTYRMQRAVTQMRCVFMRVYYIKVDRWWIRPWLEPVRVFIEQVGRRTTKIKKIKNGSITVVGGGTWLLLALDQLKQFS